jgi:hypothetical protein
LNTNERKKSEKKRNQNGPHPRILQIGFASGEMTKVAEILGFVEENCADPWSCGFLLDTLHRGV